MNAADILFSIDGMLAQVSIARQLAEAKGESTVGIDGVAAAAMTLRAVVETEAVTEAVEAETGPCKHPKDSTYTQQLGGGAWYIMCRACNEIIEQSQ